MNTIGTVSEHSVGVGDLIIAGSYLLFLVTAVNSTAATVSYKSSIRGAAGQNGTNGTNGTNGKDGLTTSIDVGGVTYDYDSTTGKITFPANASGVAGYVAGPTGTSGANKV